MSAISTSPNIKSDTDRIVDSDYVGEGWAPVEPGSDPVLYGHAPINPQGCFEVEQRFK